MSSDLLLVSYLRLTLWGGPGSDGAGHRQLWAAPRRAGGLSYAVRLNVERHHLDTLDGRESQLKGLG
jgi:hypothetical protein